MVLKKTLPNGKKKALPNGEKETHPTTEKRAHPNGEKRAPSNPSRAKGEGGSNSTYYLCKKGFVNSFPL